MDLDSLAKWGDIKGINILGTGDFTHHIWIKEIKNKLEPLDNGLYKLKGSNTKVKFILTSEISCIYSQAGKVRKIHLVVLAPSIETVEKINSELKKIGNIMSDGRPILGISAYNLANLIFSINSNCMIIPAHIWTPWFSIFGSNSGFNSVEECFADLTPNIFVLETGLSSDPEMNWRLSKIDKFGLISCSDAHSPANLGREATVFEVADNIDVGYELISQMIQDSRSKNYLMQKNKLDYTIEFFPEEGKYHFDGHRLCNNTVLKPSESIKLNNICPVCKKKLTIGVSNRVEELADREENYILKNAPSSKHIIPLQEIIAESMGVQKNSSKVQAEYHKMIGLFGSEFGVLLDVPIENIGKDYDKKIAYGIDVMRQEEVFKIPGFDGVYGAIKVFNKYTNKSSNNSNPNKKIENRRINENKQTKLF